MPPTLNDRIELTLQPSQWMRVWFYFLLFAVLVPALILSVNNAWIAASIVPWLVLWRVQSKDWLDPESPGFIRHVMVSGRELECQYADGRLEESTLNGEALVLSWLMILPSMASDRRRLWLVLWPDSSDRQSLRQLRLYLRTTDFSETDESPESG